MLVPSIFRTGFVRGLASFTAVVLRRNRLRYLRGLRAVVVVGRSSRVGKLKARSTELV